MMGCEMSLNEGQMQWLTECKISGRIGGMPLHDRRSLSNTGQMETHMDQMFGGRGGGGGRGVRR